MADIVTCKNCGQDTYAEQPQCFRCGAIGYEEENLNGHRLAPGHRLVPDPVNLTKEQVAQLSISDHWLNLDLEIVRHHPLFGTFGWLRLFQFTLFIGPILGLAFALTVAANADSRDTSWILFNLIVDFGYLVWALWLTAQLAEPQPRSTRYVYIYIITAVATGFVTIIIAVNLSRYSFAPIGNVLVAHVIKSTMVATIWALYFTRSKRVNVTYRHRVELWDPFVKILGIDLSAIPHDESWAQKAGTHAAELASTARDTVAPHVKYAMKGAANGVAKSVSSLRQQEPIAADNFSSRLTALKKALDDGLITEDDFEKKKKTILNDL